MKVLITGGLGFIGSHTVVAFLEQNIEVIIVDNLSNSEYFILDRIEQITYKKPIFYNVDLTNMASLMQVFNDHKDIDVVIHFAAYKSVAESVTEPNKYFRNNITSLINLLDCVKDAQKCKVVFSSSATVYGQSENLPVRETEPFKPALSAYGASKQMGEEILKTIANAHKIPSIALRYFNPVGAHKSGLIGELPKGVPNNLMPYLTQTKAGKRDMLTVYGNDYNTKDGTAVRDYIHVVDLAEAHVMAALYLDEGQSDSIYEAFNVGTGNGITVLEVIKAFENVNGIKLNYCFGNRRDGDVESSYADTTKIHQIIKWKAIHNLDDMVRDAWKWEKSLC